MNEQTLRDWIYAARGDAQSDSTEAISVDDKEELRQLRRRVKVLEQERKILKKAAAWFAKETGSTP